MSRRVTHTSKDQDGDILALCNPDQPWSRRSKQDAINDIESGRHSYYVRTLGGVRVRIQVVHGSTGKYLRTVADRNNCNNLGDLPDC